MDDEIREHIEKEHNVYVSEDGQYFTTGEQKDNYGWQPLPQEWKLDAIYKDFDLE